MLVWLGSFLHPHIHACNYRFRLFFLLNHLSIRSLNCSDSAKLFAFHFRLEYDFLRLYRCENSAASNRIKLEWLYVMLASKSPNLHIDESKQNHIAFFRFEIAGKHQISSLLSETTRTQDWNTISTEKLFPQFCQFIFASLLHL